jgi:predicted dienelactone hydrolase
MSASAGCRLVEVADGAVPTGGFPALVMYPAAGPEHTVAFPPYTAEVAMDAAVAPGPHHLVLISHGTGSWHLVHRALGAHLARNGFVVAMPVHPGDNREDDSAVGTPDNLGERPRHLRVLADRLAADDLLGRQLSGRVAAIGHSMGGGTVLALAGGRPATLPHEEPDGVAHPVAVEPDPRIGALVLLAPATAAFRQEGALGGVRVPVLMLTGERDEVTTGVHAQIVATGLPARAPLEHHVIAGAGHNSFLSPYPAEMTGPQYPASLDPEGFDRRAFHDWMAGEILGFLRRVL